MEIQCKWVVFYLVIQLQFSGISQKEWLFCPYHILRESATDVHISALPNAILNQHTSQSRCILYLAIYTVSTLRIRQAKASSEASREANSPRSAGVCWLAGFNMASNLRASVPKCQLARQFFRSLFTFFFRLLSIHKNAVVQTWFSKYLLGTYVVI